MDTDAHGSKTKDSSVSIRVNLWLKLVFPQLHYENTDASGARVVSL
jgi:hypothetical protein